MPRRLQWLAGLRWTQSSSSSRRRFKRRLPGFLRSVPQRSWRCERGAMAHEGRVVRDESARADAGRSLRCRIARSSHRRVVHSRARTRSRRSAL
jgi:hypothetical protein